MTIPEDARRIDAAIDASEQLLRNLVEPIRARPETPLLDGDWTVRDALCHVAARANDVPLILRLTDRRTSGEASSMMAELDATNARQIADRSARTVDELVAEALAGYGAAHVAVSALDEAQLDQVLDVPSLGSTRLADLLVLTYQGHAQAHLRSIEAALAAARS
ncbi:MAG: maleylpyruvate isomerase N-terminal domain-containing protein [Chloroflexi bacterium]|nr:maleylpyruvate isomerase N-terminal domain-containing protein [Chloroflexota bacterium]